MQAEYFISPTEWTSQARAVAPLRYQRMDQVSTNTHSIYKTHNVPVAVLCFLLCFISTALLVECIKFHIYVNEYSFSSVSQVRVSYVFGSSGVVGDCVFFSLDSLLLPAGYKPTEGDVVSVVVVESNQSLYCWRALCMAPLNKHR